MPEYGILHLSATITDLQPQDKERVYRQQVESWKARWQRRMLEELGEAEADAERVLGVERAAVQAEVISSIGEAIAGVGTGDSAQAATVVALRFVESLRRMIERAELGERLAPEVVETIGKMPHIIGGEPPAAGGSGPAGQGSVGDG